MLPTMNSVYSNNHNGEYGDLFIGNNVSEDDPFYSPENIARLEIGALAVKEGRCTVHELTEVE